MKIFLIFLCVMNILTFFAFGVDKRKAIKGSWRISEKTLLLMGLCFGSVGQIAGMRIFHHKTHKWYFVISGYLFLVLQIGFIYFLFTYI